MDQDFKVKIDVSQLNKVLKRLQKELKDVRGVKVGYFEGKYYPAEDGKKSIQIAQNALIQEFGAKIHIPEQRRTIYRSYNEKRQDFNRRGRFVKQKEGNFAQDVVIPAHDVVIPPRPFMRQTIQKNEESWQRKFNFFAKKELPLYQIMALMGEEIKKDIIETITNLEEPKNAPSTIRKKKSSNPLVDTGTLRNSVAYMVLKNDGN